MTADDLISEGRRLARPCVHLRPDGEAAAAVWRGEGLVPPPGGGYEHWLTIDCRFSPAAAGPPAGCLSVYTDEGDGRGAVTHDPLAALSQARGGRLLFAHPAESLPPSEAVLLRGSPAVAAWLASLGWPAEWGWNGNFPDESVAEAYAEAQRVNLPPDGESVLAVLGGWPVPWPDGGWPE